MARRFDPERIYEAKRAGLLMRLVQSHHIPQDRAESLFAAWEQEAAQRGLDRSSPAFWSEGADWTTATIAPGSWVRDRSRGCR